MTPPPIPRVAAFVLLVVSALTGCGGPPEASAHLVAAREAYAAAASAQDISALAPAALAEAHEALEQAEQAWRERRDTAEVAHRAHVAQQRVRIAKERAELRSTEEAIRRARIERHETLLELRATKAEAPGTVDGGEAAAPAPPDVPPTEATEGDPAAPDPLGAVLTRRGLVLTLPGDAFTHDGRLLPPKAAPTLDALVGFLNEYPERRVRIEGFTDASDTHAENLELSQRLADAVKAALVERGIAPARVGTRAYGAAPPLPTDAPAAERGANYHVEVIISDPQGVIPERD